MGYVFTNPDAMSVDDLDIHDEFKKITDADEHVKALVLATGSAFALAVRFMEEKEENWEEEFPVLVEFIGRVFELSDVLLDTYAYEKLSEIFEGIDLGIPDLEDLDLDLDPNEV